MTEMYAHKYQISAGGRGGGGLSCLKPTFTCSKLTIKTVEEEVKYVQSSQ